MKITEVAQNILVAFFHDLVIHKFWPTMLGCTLGDFFANSSGHPGWKLKRKKVVRKNAAKRS
jgi:hypothetical protein